METRKRSMMKSITWRIVGVVLLSGITWLVTRDWKDSTIITVVFHSIRMVMYYFHERIWLRVNWGRVRHPLDEINMKAKPRPEDMEELRAKLRAMGYID
jgi:uncharacterized membrane protein